MDEPSRELATYLRTEYRGADAEWMAHRIRKAAAKRRGFRSQLARIAARGAPDAARGVPQPASTVAGGGLLPGSTVLVPVDECPHEDVEPMGRDGSTVFARCRACGVLLIESPRSLYLLRPSATAPTVASLSASA